MKKEDIEFLKDLQRELNEQTNDGNAEPLYWGVMERKLVPVPEGCGDEYIVDGDGGRFTLPEFVDEINELVLDCDEEIQDQWVYVDKEDIFEVLDFAKDKIDSNYDSCDFEKQDVLSDETGCFLTKRAAKEYIEKYGYNHKEPRTYAMTAYRNFEYGRLLDILKHIDFDDIKED